MCADNEVVPDGQLACVACPVLSAPASPTECECLPGYFGAITGAFAAQQPLFEPC